MTTAYKRWRVNYVEPSGRHRKMLCWRKTPEEAAAYCRECLSLDGFAWKRMWVEDDGADAIEVNHG